MYTIKFKVSVLLVHLNTGGSSLYPHCENQLTNTLVQIYTHSTLMEDLTSTLVLILETIGIATCVLVVYFAMSFYMYVRRMKKVFKGVHSPDNYSMLLGHLPTVSTTWCRLTFRS